MKILIVCPGFTESSILAQPWRHAYEVARDLIASGHNVSIATDGLSKKRIKETQTCNIPTYIVPITGLPFKRMNPDKIKSIVRHLSLDLIYWIGYPSIGTYLKKFKDQKCKNIVHINSNIYSLTKLRLSVRECILLSYRIYFYLDNPLTKLLIRLLNQNTIQLITVPNNAIKLSLLRNGVIKKKIEVLPIQIYNTGLFTMYALLDRLETRKEFGYKERDFVVTYFGSPNTLRGTDTTLNAVNKLKQKCADLKLLMLLRRSNKEVNADEKFLERLSSKLELHDIVKFIPRLLSTEDLAKFLKLSDLILLPFKFLFSEPPLSLLEAMALGKPLISTRISGIPELVGKDCGLLVNPGNASELAGAIHSVMNDPSMMKKLGRKAKERAESFHSVKSVADFLNSFFQSS